MSENSRLQITDIKTVVVNAQMRNWVFVKVETDTPGLDGWGEASLEWKTRAVAGAVEDLKPFIVGDDPTRIEHLYQKLYRQPFFRPGIVGQSAISGIEMACWDILGKRLGVPVYKLLGGAVRDRVRMYTHLGGGDMSAVYDSFDATRVIDLALQVVNAGYTAVKVVFVPYSEPLMGTATSRNSPPSWACCAKPWATASTSWWTSTAAPGPPSPSSTSTRIAEYRPYFVEEPVPQENVDALLQVRRAVNVPIATGERLVTRHQFREIFEKQACHVIQPDLCHCGGLWEAKKIAAMAESYYMGVAPHNPLGPIANAAALHFALSTPNFLIQEDMLTDVPWRWEVVESSLRTENGYWLPCDEPGLGVRVNEKAAAAHPFEQEKLASVIYAPDGAVLDW